jgi:AAA15 family ATPase/GTPase
MLQEITIKNFKSIADDTIELGRVNVFIGENGCGKSNILEAVGFASAGIENRLENENLISKGVRVAKPSLILSDFRGKKQIKSFSIALPKNENTIIEYKLNDLLEFVASKSQIAQMPTDIGNQLLEYIDMKSNFPNIDSQILRQKFPELEEYTAERLKKMNARNNLLKNYLIYELNTPALRGLSQISHKEPVGIYGENLDMLLASFDKDEIAEIKEYQYLISWLDDFFIDATNSLKFQGYKPNRSKSTLYFTDKFMSKKNNIFSVENANEGILHVLFYLSILISRKTPPFFAIDNIESCLNPHLCRHIMTEICKLAQTHDKQLLITTHNPAILDGLNLFDDEVRLFAVSRNKFGHTVTERIKIKPEHEQKEGRKLKLSDLWTRGYLGAISENY